MGISVLDAANSLSATTSITNGSSDRKSNKANNNSQNKDQNFALLLSKLVSGENKYAHPAPSNPLTPPILNNTVTS